MDTQTDSKAGQQGADPTTPAFSVRLPENLAHLALHFRPISEYDLPFLLNLYSLSRQSELSQVDWPEAQKQAFLAQQFNAQHHYYQQHFSTAHFDLIEFGGTAIGRLYWNLEKQRLCLIDIILLPAYQHQGIGTAIIRGLMRAAANEAKRLELHVENNNPVRLLYSRLGFAHTGDSGVYQKMVWEPHTEQPLTPSTVADALEME